MTLKYGWCALYENALARSTVVSFPSIQAAGPGQHHKRFVLIGMDVWTWWSAASGGTQLSTMDMAPLVGPTKRTPVLYSFTQHSMASVSVRRSFIASLLIGGGFENESAFVDRECVAEATKLPKCIS